MLMAGAVDVIGEDLPLAGQLACPACRSSHLQLVRDHYRCGDCGRAYPILEGVADFRTAELPHTEARFYALPSYRKFSANLQSIHEAHYQEGSFSRFVEDRLKDALRSLRPEASGLVVELGCGATPMIDWAESPARYIGVDLSMELLQEAKAKYPEAHFLCADSRAMPIAGGAAALVIANAVLEHVFHLEETIAEIARCIAAAGRLAVMVPTEGGLAVDLARLYTSRSHGRILGITPRQSREAQRRDHCNTVYAVENALTKYFKAEKVKYWPFRIGGTSFNLSKCFVLRPLSEEGE